MRKLLLACAAAVGFTGAASAAQLTTNSDKVEPGKMVVRLDTKLLFLAGISSDSANSTATGKNQNYGFDGFVRLYPSMNAETMNGIKYGASVEIRTNSAGGATGAASGNSAKQTFYIRRAYGYIGTDAAGQLRFGQIDGPMGALKVGDMQSVGDGGVNGDAPDFIPSYYAWQFPFSVGNEYTQSKIIYLSPNLSGFDFGVSFAPSTSTLLGAFTPAAVGSPSLRSTTGVDPRPRDIFEVNGRYRGTFSGVGVAANVGYVGSGRIADASAPKTVGLSIIDAGATVSYMGLTVGGHMSTGKFNGQMYLTAKGEKDAMVYIVGANYENGPYAIGAHYANVSQPGVIGDGSARKIHAVAVGGHWDWAPGAEAIAELVTGESKEAGVTKHGTGFVIGQRFRW